MITNNLKHISFLFLMFFATTLLAQSEVNYKSQIKEHRKHYKADFLKNERSPFFGKKRALKKLSFFKADESYKVECSFQRTADAEPFDMATYSGNVKSFVKYGTLSFEIDGKSHELAVYRNLGLMRIEAYANHLFLPFKDTTNDNSTYGGGRYIDLEVGDIVDDKFTLDFNTCYNPWCAFSGGYNCPIPPKENHLAIAINAGEKKYKGKRLDK